MNLKAQDSWARPVRGESARAWAAFNVYVGMSPQERSLVAVAAKLGKSTTICSRWSAKFGWVSRALAHDAAMQAKEQSAREAARVALAVMREQEEAAQFDQFREAKQQAFEKYRQLLKLPNTDVSQAQMNDSGIIVRENRVKGLAPGQIKAVYEIAADAAMRAVHGHVRLSKSMRIEAGADESGTLAQSDGTGPEAAPAVIELRLCKDPADDPTSE